MDETIEVGETEAGLSDLLTNRIVAFLRGVGLTIHAGEIPGPSFLPGIVVEHGGLLFDPARLRFPCDLLHEAGHLAVVPPERRALSPHAPLAARERGTAGVSMLTTARADASAIPFVMATERGAGFGQFVGRWDEKPHRAAFAPARHVYFIGRGGFKIIAL